MVSAMAIEAMLRTVDSLYKSVGGVLKSVSGEGKAKRTYRDILSDIQSTLALLRRFLALAHCLERNLPNPTRLCHRWFLSKHDNIVTLVKLEPRITISFDGSKLKVTYDHRELEFEGSIIRYRVNSFRDEINLRDEDAIIEKRSLIREAVGAVKSIITHVMPDMELCIKEHRIRC